MSVGGGKEGQDLNYKISSKHEEIDILIILNLHTAWKQHSFSAENISFEFSRITGNQLPSKCHVNNSELIKWNFLTFTSVLPSTWNGVKVFIPVICQYITQQLTLQT